MLIEKAKKHPVYSVLSILLIGWLAGVATVEGIMRFSNQSLVTKDSYVLKSQIENHYVKKESHLLIKHQLSQCIGNKERLIDEIESCNQEADEKTTEITSKNTIEGVLRNEGIPISSYLNIWETTLEETVLSLSTELLKNAPLMHVRGHGRVIEKFASFKTAYNYCDIMAVYGSEVDSDQSTKMCKDHFSKCEADSEARFYKSIKDIVSIIATDHTLEYQNRFIQLFDNRENARDLDAELSAFLTIRSKEHLAALLEKRLYYFSREIARQGVDLDVKAIARVFQGYINKIEKNKGWRLEFEEISKKHTQLSAYHFYRAGFAKHRNDCVAPISNGYMGIDGWFYSFFLRRFMEGTYPIVKNVIFKFAS